eukprot:8373053-Heterocapsa_arctica.AAC.1
MDEDQQNNSHNNKRAKISDNSQKGVGQDRLLNFFSKRKTETNIHIQEPLQNIVKLNSRQIAALLKQIPTELKSEAQGQKLSAREIEPVKEPTMNTRREARGLGASA